MLRPDHAGDALDDARIVQEVLAKALARAVCGKCAAHHAIVTVFQAAVVLASGFLLHSLIEKKSADNNLMTFSQYFRLADAMARMSLRADATKLYLGYIWWILEPFLYVGVFYVVFTKILVSRQPDFLPFLMTGKLMFLWFSKSVTQASNSIVAGKGLIGNINVTKTLFPLAMIQEGLYKQVVVVFLLLLILVVMDYPITAFWFYLIPVLLVNYLMILACGYLGATIVCIMRDFFPLISLGMIFMMFTSGIFWNIRELGSPEKTELLLAINPLAFILDAYRQILLYQTAPDMLHLALVGVGFGAMLCAMVLIMRRASQYLALKALTV
ncbi:MAG: hypothetical protein Hals2KO_29200 [Halioglobus sp.]